MTPHQFFVEACFYLTLAALFAVILLMAWFSGKSKELERGIEDADENKNG